MDLGGSNHEAVVHSKATAKTKSSPAVATKPPATFRAMPGNKDPQTLKAIIDTAFETVFVRALWRFSFKTEKVPANEVEWIKTHMILYVRDASQKRQRDVSAYQQSLSDILSSATVFAASQGKTFSALQFCLPKLFLPVDYFDPDVAYQLKVVEWEYKNFSDKYTRYIRLAPKGDDNISVHYQLSSKNSVGFYMNERSQADFTGDHDKKCSSLNDFLPYKNRLSRSILEPAATKETAAADPENFNAFRRIEKGVIEIGEDFRAALIFANKRVGSRYDVSPIPEPDQKNTDSTAKDFSHSDYFFVHLAQLDKASKALFIKNAGINASIFEQLVTAQLLYLSKYEDFLCAFNASLRSVGVMPGAPKEELLKWYNWYNKVFGIIQKKVSSAAVVGELLLQAQLHPELAEPLSQIIAMSGVKAADIASALKPSGVPASESLYTLETMIGAAEQLSKVCTSRNFTTNLVDVAKALEEKPLISTQVVDRAVLHARQVFALQQEFQVFNGSVQGSQGTLDVRAQAYSKFMVKLDTISNNEEAKQQSQDPEQTVSEIAALCEVAKAPINRHRYYLRDWMLGTENTDTWKGAFKTARLAGLKALRQVVDEKASGEDETKKIEKLQYWRKNSLFAEHRNAGFGVIGTLRGWSKGAFGRTAAQKEIDEMIQSVTRASVAGRKQ